MIDKDRRVDLSVIIVSYNTKDLTINCIRSLMRETIDTNYEVIVYDNNSSDFSAQEIRNQFEDKVHLIESDTNYGFAKGNNLAVKEAKGKYILLLNPDTVILDKAVDKLIAFSKQYSQALIWGGRTLFPDRSLNPTSCWSRQTIWSLFCQALGLSSIFRNSTLFNSEGIGGWNREGIKQVDIVSGCFFLITRDVWEKLGGFNEKYFMYGEEADFCLRAKRINATPHVTSEATIIHYGGASESVRSDKLVKLIKAKSQLISDHFSKYLITAGKNLLALWPLSRMTAHYMLSKLKFETSHDKYKMWQEVWYRRRDWL